MLILSLVFLASAGVGAGGISINFIAYRCNGAKRVLLGIVSLSLLAASEFVMTGLLSFFRQLVSGELLPVSN